MERVEIHLSKTKLLLQIGGSILFIAVGVFIFTPMAGDPPLFIKAAGIAGILFFGAAGIVGVRKMFDTVIGLTIDEHGIVDNSNATSVGLIKWSDIIEIKTAQVQSTKFLLIFVKNPDYYLNQVKGLKRKGMEMNKRLYGTPLSITSSTLNYNFNDLEKLLNGRLEEQREQSPNA